MAPCWAHQNPSLKPKNGMRLSGSTSSIPNPNDTVNHTASKANTSLRLARQYTVPDFIGTRYYSDTARVVAVVCLIVISFTYVAGQMRGVGIVFSQFLDVDIELGVGIGMAVVFIYAVLGGMKGITYTQVAQYCVLIFAYLVPACFISILITDVPVPQFGFGAQVNDGSGLSVLDKLDTTLVDLGFDPYTSSAKSIIDRCAITMAMMIGTAGLPHVIVRFFTVPKVSDARLSAGYALVFIAALYTTAPAVGVFARLNFIDTVHGESPDTLILVDEALAIAGRSSFRFSSTRIHSVPDRLRSMHWWRH